MPSDYVYVGSYRLEETLGTGSFGKVKLATHLHTGIKVAIKILSKEKIRQLEMSEKVKREIQILRSFKHPHIVRLYEVIDTPSDLFLVTEYVPGGELFDYIVRRGRVLFAVEMEHSYLRTRLAVFSSRLLVESSTATTTGWCIETSSRRTCCWTSITISR